MDSLDWLVPEFEQFEPRLLMSADPTAMGLLSSAVVVDVVPEQRTQVVGDVESSDSPVLYKFTAPAAGKILIDMSALSGGIDPYLVLYNDALVRLTANDNVARGSLDSRITRTVTAGQTFYVLASGGGDTAGMFTLSVTSDPRDDYGNQTDQARRMTLRPNGSAAISGVVNYTGDNDYLSFVATQTGLATVLIAAAGRSSTLTPDLAVRDAQGELVSTQVVGGSLGAGLGATDGAVSFAVVAGQRYYLQAAGSDGSVGGYSISMRPTLAQEFVTAQNVVVAATGHPTVSGSLASGAKFTYKFTASADGYVLLEMAAANGSPLDSMLQVFNSDQRVVAWNDNASTGTAGSRVRLAVKQGQTYYVRASATAGSAGDYALTFTGQPTDDYGNDMASGKAIWVRADGSASGSGTINFAGDHDFLKYTATRTGQAEIVVALSGIGNALKGAVSIYAADGSLVASGLAGADGSVDLRWSVTAGGQYYVDLSGTDQTTGRYTWRVLATTLVDFPTAQNLSVPALGVLSTSGTLPVGGFRTYKFTALADGTVTVDMAAANSSGLDSRLEAYDSTQRQLAANDNASAGTTNSRLTFAIQAGHTYYVRAMAVGVTHGDYSMNLTSQPTDDTGNDVAHASSLVLGVDGSGSSGRAINYIADVDVLRIVATANGTMQVRMAAAATSSVRPSIAAASAAGASLAAGGDGTGTVVITFAVTAGQTYYLTASALNATAGQYTLTISTDSVVPVPDPNPPAPPAPTDPLAGDTVLGTVVTDGTGTHLIIAGTNGNDVITLSYAGGATTVKTAYGTQSFLGQYSQIVIYGFAGDDVIRDDYTITCPVTVYGGDGNDTIYDSGPGASILNGGEGNDTIVTVGGGIDTIYAGGGMDSVWSDSTDLLMDGSAGEVAGGNIHTIANFYQPYTSNSNLAGYVSKEISGQNLQDPEGDGYTHGWANYSDRPLFAGTPTYNDIRQGSVGDCYYLSSLASLADADPNLIRQMIVSLGDGTYAVRFYRNNQEVYLRVDADLPLYSGTSLSYAKLTPDGEIWVALAEKAYCYFRYGQNSYASISGGWMSTVYQELTGKTASTVWTGGTAATVATAIANALAAGHAITAGSYASPPSPIIGGHAYEIKAIQGSGDSAIVTVYNPWGYDGRGSDDNYNDGLIRITMAQLQASFSALVISAA